jgi:hypothetical protein
MQAPKKRSLEAMQGQSVEFGLQSKRSTFEQRQVRQAKLCSNTLGRTRQQQYIPNRQKMWLFVIRLSK